MNLELRQLRYFVAVADTTQLTDAARRLSIAQPTLSQALAQLEERLGVQLLERHSRGVHLTDAGRAFLDKARTAVRAADEALETANAFKRGRSETLAIGFHEEPLSRWASMFQRLCELHPGTDLRWKALDFPVAGRSPIEEVDVGLLVEPTPRPDLSALVLERQPRMVVVAPSHPLAGRRELTVADVLDETWPGGHPSLDPRWQAFWTLDEERGGPARATTDRVITADEGVAAVASGRAIVTVTEGLAAAFPNPGMVAIPLVDARPATLALVWRTAYGNPLVESLVEIARELVESDAVHGRAQEPADLTAADGSGERPHGAASTRGSGSFQ